MINSSFLLILLRRQIVRHPWQTFIGIMGIALGVAIVLSIDLTNTSATRAFEIASQAVSGDVTHQIFNDTEGIDETLYASLRRKLGLQQLYPVVEGLIVIDNKPYQLTGIDPVSFFNRDLKPSRSGDQGTRDNNGHHFLSLMTEPNSVLISDAVIDKGSNGIPATIDVSLRGRSETLNVLGSVSSNDSGSDLISDIGTAQDLLGMPGKLSRIDIKVNDRELEAVKGLLKEPAYVVQTGAEGNALDQITRAFRTNLTALSLLALVIGAFLIFNTMMISILQRRDQIATMRTLGLSRSELVGLIMFEVFLLALSGILLGTGIGVLLSQFLIKLASRTLNDLYFIREVQSVYLSAGSFLKASALGFLASFISSLIPLRDALTITPRLSQSRSFVESQSHANHGRLLASSGAMFIAGFLVLQLSKTGIIIGFAGLFFIIAAFACLTPLLLLLILKCSIPLLRMLFGYTGLLAGRGVKASLSRTQVAVVALSVAISATIGVSIMISSFRHSVDLWLEGFLKADIYISSADRSVDNAITPKTINQIRAYPGVYAVTTSQWKRVWIDSTPVRMNIIGVDRRAFDNYRFISRSSDNIWPDFNSDKSIIISEPYAYRNHLKPGDSVYLPTGDTSTLLPFDVVGIFTDYSSDQGVIVMHENVYRSIWTDHKITSLSVYLENPSALDHISAGLGASILRDVGLRTRANRSLRDMSLAIFDRTFAITEVLRLLTVIIASMGILGALLAIQLERTREFAVMRAQGMTGSELVHMMMTESGLIGLISGLLAIPLGVTMAVILIDVINLRSFGWTMSFILEPQYLFSALGLGLLAGMLAGLYPAWHMLKISPSEAMRYE